MAKNNSHSQTSIAGAISKILIARGALPEVEALALEYDFAHSAKENFIEFLLDEGLVDASDILNALEELYGVPSFDAVGHEFERELLQKFPRGFLLRHGIIPLEVKKGVLTIVVSEPDEQDLVEKIKEQYSGEIRLMVGIRQDIMNAVKEFYDEAQQSGLHDDKRKKLQQKKQKKMEELDLGFDREYGE